MSTENVVDLLDARQSREAIEEVAELTAAVRRTATILAEQAADLPVERIVGGDRIRVSDLRAAALMWLRGRIVHLECEELRHAIKRRTGIDIAEDVGVGPSASGEAAP